MDTPIQEVLAKIGQDMRVAIVADSSVSGKVTLGLKNKPLPEALDVLCKQLGLTWRRIFLPRNQNIAPDKLSEIIRALKALEVAGIFIEDPATGQGTSLMKNFPLQPGYDAQMTAGGSAFKAVYLVTDEKASKTAQARKEEKGSKDQKPGRVQRYVDIAREQMEMLMQMTPEERREAMMAGMQMFMNMDPQARQQMMQMGMQMGMEMFQQMDPQMRQQLIEQSMQAFQQMFQNQNPPAK